MSKLRSKYSIVGDIRGKGLMIGIELVDGNGSNVPLDPHRFMEFWEFTRDAGVLIGRGGHFGNVMKMSHCKLFYCNTGDYYW